MTGANLHLADYHAFMDKQGRNPNDFEITASLPVPSEGELGPSRRVVTVTHKSSGACRTYALRTWLADFAGDVGTGVFHN